ncbi:hypothetical protein D7W82_03830 [Corallococcus sp. CA049B]|nr:hypothetical protein D7W82_03830 [Corallococcus sp. CA049B]
MPIQEWQGPQCSGYTFLAVDHHAETDKVLVLESNAVVGLDGVGYRGLGSLRDVGLQPPAQLLLRRRLLRASGLLLLGPQHHRRYPTHLAQPLRKHRLGAPPPYVQAQPRSPPLVSLSASPSQH